MFSDVQSLAVIQLTRKQTAQDSCLSCSQTRYLLESCDLQMQAQFFSWAQVSRSGFHSDIAVIAVISFQLQNEKRLLGI